MYATVPPAPADYLRCTILELTRVLAATAERRADIRPLMLLLWSRLRRLADRFAALAARAAAGPLPAPRRRPPAARPSRPRPPGTRLPEGFAWLIRMVPEARFANTRISHLLGSAEMAALLAAAPQAGRLLRPLCRTLGVPLPPALALPPRRRRKRKPRSAAVARPKPAGAALPAIRRQGSKPARRARPPPAFPLGG